MIVDRVRWAFELGFQILGFEISILEKKRVKGLRIGNSYSTSLLQFADIDLKPRQRLCLASWQAMDLMAFTQWLLAGCTKGGQSQWKLAMDVVGVGSWVRGWQWVLLALGFWVIKWLFGTLFLSCDSVIQIHNHWVPLKKKDVWYTIFKWRLKSQLEFYVGPMTNLRTSISLFLNPSRIQIRTEFTWVPVLLLLLAMFLFSSFSLSLLQTILCFPLSFSWPLQSPWFSLFITLSQTPHCSFIYT